MDQTVVKRTREFVMFVGYSSTLLQATWLVMTVLKWTAYDDNVTASFLKVYKDFQIAVKFFGILTLGTDDFISDSPATFITFSSIQLLASFTLFLGACARNSQIASAWKCYNAVVMLLFILVTARMVFGPESLSCYWTYADWACCISQAISYFLLNLFIMSKVSEFIQQTKPVSVLAGVSKIERGETPGTVVYTVNSYFKNVRNVLCCLSNYSLIRELSMLTVVLNVVLFGQLYSELKCIASGACGVTSENLNAKHVLTVINLPFTMMKIFLGFALHATNETSDHQKMQKWALLQQFIAAIGYIELLLTTSITTRFNVVLGYFFFTVAFPQISAEIVEVRAKEMELLGETQPRERLPAPQVQLIRVRDNNNNPFSPPRDGTANVVQVVERVSAV